MKIYIVERLEEESFGYFHYAFHACFSSLEKADAYISKAERNDEPPMYKNEIDRADYIVTEKEIDPEFID